MLDIENEPIVVKHCCGIVSSHEDVEVYFDKYSCYREHPVFMLQPIQEWDKNIMRHVDHYKHSIGVSINLTDLTSAQLGPTSRKFEVLTDVTKYFLRPTWMGVDELLEHCKIHDLVHASRDAKVDIIFEARRTNQIILCKGVSLASIVDEKNGIKYKIKKMYLLEKN